MYNDQHKLSMLIHPEFKKACGKSINVDPYYRGKYKYLKEHGFFQKNTPANFDGVIDESMVNDSIIQTQQITFEVTDHCNLKCSYCSFKELYEGFDERNQKNINTRQAIKLLKYIFDLKHKNRNNKLIIGFYEGEPLLNIKFIKKIIEVVNQLKSKKEIGISYAMTTNATLIHKYIDFLVANKFMLLISLDGNEANHSYRVFRKNNQNSFQTVIENVDMIQRDYPKYFDTYVNFNAVLHNRNSVKEIYEFIYSRYHKFPRIAELSSDNINPEKKDCLGRMFHRKRKSEAEYQKEENNLLPHSELLLFKDLTDFLKQHSINYYVSNITASLHSKTFFLPTGTCLPFQKKMYLTNRNKLLPCERINFKYSIGKVEKNVLIDIPEIVRQYNFYYEHLKKVCKSCYSYRYCGLCMFRINNLDKLDTEKLVCDWYYDRKTFQNKLCRIFSFLEKHPNDFYHIIEDVTFL